MLEFSSRTALLGFLLIEIYKMKKKKFEQSLLFEIQKWKNFLQVGFRSLPKIFITKNVMIPINDVCDIYKQEALKILLFMHGVSCVILTHNWEDKIGHGINW